MHAASRLPETIRRLKPAGPTPVEPASARRRGLTTLLAAGVAIAVLGPVVAATGPVRAQQPGSGLPLPRFASLGADRINARTGPGKQYPIRWVYARGGLPVKIVAEFDTWRRIEDHEGDQGWIHVSLLSSRRTVMVTGTIRDVRRQPRPDARTVVRAEPGVIARLRACENGWCEVELAGSSGWIDGSALWGLLPGEQGG